MSSVRRAMAEMGLAGCCAWCDAPDTPGSERCRTCIAAHRIVRDRLASGADGPVDQAARHLLSLMAEPHRHDHDPVHGPVLREQMRRLGVSPRRKATTQADVEAAFAASRARDKGSVVKTVGNRLSEVPEASAARELGEEMFDPQQINAEARRTIPSRPIDAVDRSDRLGEDPALEARIAAERKAAEEPTESLRAVVEKAHIEGSLKRREALGGLLDELDDLLDSDES